MTDRFSGTRWKRPISVLVLVATRDGQVLVMERVSPPGFWQSVTGTLEQDELPAEAAQRELAEETGIRLAPEDLGYFTDFPIRDAWRHRYAPEVHSNREHVFAVSLPTCVEVILNPLEHQRHEWLGKARALERISSPSNRAALETWSA